MTQTVAPPIERHLAVDLHKHYLVIGGVDAHQQQTLPPRRIPLDDWPSWAHSHLRPTDTLVVEATTNTWWFYDLTAPLVAHLLVADPRKVAWIANSRVKTDPHDVMKLARLSAAGLVPTIWVPPPEVRELRSLLAHRRRLVGTQTLLKNRLQSLLHRLHIPPPQGEPFADKYRPWWHNLPLSPTEHLHVRHDLATLDQLAQQIAELDDELARLSTSPPWSDLMPYLLQVPGVGLIVAMTLLSAIGDITRFPTARKLVGYSGLAPSVHDSGLTHHSGPITKEGRKEMRHALVEAAQHAVQSSDFWKARFLRLCQRMPRNKAIVAIARQLLVLIWHLLTDHATDRHADPDKVAFKLITWSWKLTNAQRGGLNTRQFARYHLLRLRLGNDLSHVTRGRGKYRIAPSEEVLRLKPELQAGN